MEAVVEFLDPNADECPSYLLEEFYFFSCNILMDAETRFHAFGLKSIWSTDTWSTEHKKKFVDQIYVDQNPDIR